MIVSHIVAAVSVILRSAQYAGTLKIARAERVRYVKKSISFALCYAGFGTPWNLSEAWKAGEAAFLCCAYDVVTDWRHFNTKAKKTFENILCARMAQSELRELALGLYEKELHGELSDDGLERGAIALRFTLKTMGCEKQREATWGNLNELGQLLQIVDDVLDYEDDAACGDTNCLATINRTEYLRRILEGLNSGETRRLFGPARSLLIVVIDHATKKATELLEAQSTECAGIPSKGFSPRANV